MVDGLCPLIIEYSNNDRKENCVIRIPIQELDWEEAIKIIGEEVEFIIEEMKCEDYCMKPFDRGCGEGFCYCEDESILNSYKKIAKINFDDYIEQLAENFYKDIEGVSNFERGCQIQGFINGYKFANK